MSEKLFLLFLIVINDVTAHKLVQMVILSRHNIRTPLSSNLERFTPKTWPKWTEESSFLTAKGAILESYMGEYFSQLLKQEDLFQGECPPKDSIFIYANAPQRTRETAKEFVKMAFKDCNVTVNFKENVTTDPVFHPVIRNKTETFKLKAIEEIQRKLDGLKLENAYKKLNKILDFKKSRICKETGFCDLTKKKDDILFKVGEEPDVFGPLSIGNTVVDAFLMEFYNGTSLQNIGWGGIESDDWNTLTRITKENQNVRFNSTYLAKDLAGPLLGEIKKLTTNEKIKFALLVGHDSNINSVIASLKFKPFELPDQYERSPVGGKLIFQKWQDRKTGKNLLKIDYVYQTTEQIRQESLLSLESPPNYVTMELSDCESTENGFCDWDNFLQIIGKF